MCLFVSNAISLAFKMLQKLHIKPDYIRSWARTMKALQLEHVVVFMPVLWLLGLLKNCVGFLINLTPNACSHIFFSFPFEVWDSFRNDILIWIIISFLCAVGRWLKKANMPLILFIKRFCMQFCLLCKSPTSIQIESNFKTLITHIMHILTVFVYF